MELTERKIGFWTGMPARLKAQLIGWSIYWAMAVWLVALGSMTGLGLLIAPILWFISKAWVFDSFLELDSTKVGILNYTVGCIWSASRNVRTFFMIGVSAIMLGGLGWLGTADLRKEAAELTLSEKVSETVSSAAETTVEKGSAFADATKNTAKGWAASVKGWFFNDDVVAE